MEFNLTDNDVASTFDDSKNSGFHRDERKSMKRILVFVFVVLAAIPVFPTAQFPDLLIYNGETLAIFSNPLESYFSEANPRPSNLFKFSCTACWRGYVATWEIKDGNFSHQGRRRNLLW